LTASSLNSAVYELLEIFISCLPKVTSILRHLWKTKFQGKLSATVWIDIFFLHNLLFADATNYPHNRLCSKSSCVGKQTNTTYPFIQVLMKKLAINLMHAKTVKIALPLRQAQQPTILLKKCYLTDFG